MWWIKVRRAQNPDDYETWEENQVHPTLSKFDVGDVRTVALVEAEAILLRDCAGKPGGGKGPLLSEELSLTLLNHNEQVLFQLFEADRRDGIRLHDEVTPTLQSFMGTGGNNVPMVQTAIPIQDGRDIEKHQNGLGVGEESDPSYTLDRTGGQSVFAIQNTVIGRKDENGPQGKGYGEETDPMFTLDRSSPHAVAFEPGSIARNAGPAGEQEVVSTLRANMGDNQPAVRITYGYDEYNDAITEELHNTLRSGTKQSTGVLAPTLTASNNPSRSPQSTEITKQVESVEMASTVVRRLTPTECERLQGFPTIFEWNENMTRDELCVALLSAGHITVDTEQGRIWRHRGPGGMELPNPIEVHGSNVNGYLVGNLQIAGVKRQVRLHRLVWIAANGMPESGMAVCHKDNNKTNNSISNLYLATPEQNTSDAHRDGLVSHQSKVNPKELVFDKRNGKTVKELMESYGISRSRVYQILKDYGWTEGQSDSHRYKQMGNAVTVNVVEWVGKAIMEAENYGRQTSDSTSP